MSTDITLKVHNSQWEAPSRHNNKLQGRIQDKRIFQSKTFALEHTENIWVSTAAFQRRSNCYTCSILPSWKLLIPVTASMAEGDTCSIYVIRRGQKSAHTATELLTFLSMVSPSSLLQGQKQKMGILNHQAATQCILTLHCFLDTNPGSPQLQDMLIFSFYSPCL